MASTGRLLGRFFILVVLAISAPRPMAGNASSAGLEFSVSFPESAFAGPFTGRVVVYVSRIRRGEPRMGPNWMIPQPIFSKRFTEVRAGEPMVVGDDAVSFPPKPLSRLEPSEYTVQAVVDLNLGGGGVGFSPGNLYSEAKRMWLDPTATGTVSLVCDRVVEEPAFRASDRVKELRVRSALLTTFYGRPSFLRAAVVLPPQYASEPERRFPVIYSIPEFGVGHRGWGVGRNEDEATVRAGEPFVFVGLDPGCPTGHSVFADSANNGPWGKALTAELIPELEKRYRVIAHPRARLVTGHSTGGWSSLWLQVTYPNLFGGVWSTSPDPIDFRDFQGIDIYSEGANMFLDEKGEPRPIVRTGSRPVLFFRQFSDVERPIRGERLGSFEAVFSPRGPGGEAMRLWDRDTGAIDPKVADAWRKYDIGLILRVRWRALEPKLKGKLHIYMGDMDTFYLEGAVKLVKADLAALGSDAKVELLPGDHRSVLTSALNSRIDSEMAEHFRASGLATTQRIRSR